MPRAAETILADIDTFEPADGEWIALDRLLEELWSGDVPPASARVLLRVFERYPEEDGEGVFWGIVHGLEAFPGYETALLEAVQRAPTEFSLLMVNRLLNGGRSEVDGVSLTAVLEAVAADPRHPASVREEARDYLDRARKRG